MLCSYYGESIVPRLLDLLGREEKADVRKFLIGLLVRLGEKVYGECLRRLADGRWYVRRNILHLLGEVGDREMALKAKPFCTDRDPRVRAEAARCMIKAGEDLGIATLREMVNSGRYHTAEPAIAQAGAARVEELVPDLLRRLARPAVRGSDFRHHALIVSALHRIGDPRAEGALRGILRMRSFLYRKDLQRLKAEAGRALSHFAAGE